MYAKLISGIAFSDKMEYRIGNETGAFGFDVSHIRMVERGGSMVTGLLWNSFLHMGA